MNEEDAFFDVGMDAQGFQDIERTIGALDMEAVLASWAATTGEGLTEAVRSAAPAHTGKLVDAIDYKTDLGLADAMVEIGVHGTGEPYDAVMGGMLLGNPSIYVDFVIMGTKEKKPRTKDLMSFIGYDIQWHHLREVTGNSPNPFHKNALAVMRESIVTDTTEMLAKQLAINYAY